MEVEKLKEECSDSTSKGRLLAKWLTRYIRRRAKELQLFQRNRDSLEVVFDRITLNNSYKFQIKYLPKWGIYSEKISYLTLDEYYDNRYSQSFYPCGDQSQMLLGRYNRKLIQIFGWNNLLIRLEERKEQIWK